MTSGHDRVVGMNSTHPTIDQGQLALQELFRSQVSRVHGFVLVRCGSTAVAEDVTSQVFVEAARRFAQGRTDEVTPSWLLTVARRRLIDFWRRDRTRSRTMELLRTERLTAGSNDRDDPHEQAVLAALSSLPDRQRAALALRYLDDFSVSEVAAALDMSYQAAESLLARARRSFSTAYGEMQ